ncbi:MAG: transcription elongation factor GreA [Acidimicrobiia bacterium]|nr:transcription elongation factor GreA [Acidimicrobiia bacterium]
MTEPIHLSQEAFDRLKAEFDDLTGRGRIDIARKIETARELGDLSENGDYHAAKDEQGRMESRIGQIGAMLRDAQIVSGAADGTVGVGTVVQLRYQGDTEVDSYLIGSIEERRPGVTVISPTSPLGEALLERKLGETVEYEAPSGKLKVEIVGIGD